MKPIVVSIVAAALVLVPAASASASLASSAQRADRDYEAALLGPVEVECWAVSRTVATCVGETRPRHSSEPTYVWIDHVVKFGHRLVVKAGILEEL
jgi:hypothetical protein